MSKPFDATLNSLIDDHRDEWAAFLAVRAGIPSSPAEPLDTDLSATLQADRLFRLNGPEPAVIHLELESSGRLGIPAELLRYNVAAHGVTGLPVASVLMLLRPKATATDLTGLLELRAGGAVYLTFRYTVVRVWQEPMEPFLTAGVGLTPLALLTNEAAADLDSAFVRFRERLQRPEVDDRVRQKALTASYVLSGLRYPDDRMLERFMSLENIPEDSATYQGLMRRGEARGRQDTVLEQGQERFGPPTPQAEAAVRGISDLGRLRRMGRQVLHATGWDDLLATE